MSKSDTPPENPPWQKEGKGSLRILQLSDTHLFAAPDGHLLGVDTLQTLDQVLEQARETLGAPDLVLVTGDLVHDASSTGYACLRERLATLGRPTYCLPGNHDDPEVMAGVLDGDPVGMPPWVRRDNWLLVLLDSRISGANGGHLDAGQLETLESSLAAHPHSHALVCLHHQPVAVGSNWIDSMGLDNADALFAIIDRHPQVRAILWGHIHQNFESERKGVRLIGSPSTCFQFTPGKVHFGIDREPPGCRWLTLRADGKIETGILQLNDFTATADRSSTGY